MNRSTHLRRRLLAAPLLAALIAIAAASSATAAVGPGWELSANSYPTNFVQPHNGVQQVTPEAGGTSFTLVTGEQETGAIANEAPAASVQSELEALPAIGEGNVTVSRDPATGVYTITFTGALAGKRVPTLEGGGASVAVVDPGSASGTIAVEVFNTGAGPSQGQITVTDRLPAGIHATEAGELLEPGQEGEPDFGIAPKIEQGLWDCTGNGTGGATHVAGASIVTCTNDPSGLEHFQGGGGTPTFRKPGVAHNPQPVVGIAVEAEAEASGLTNHVSIAGGAAAAPASTTDPITVSSQRAPGGITNADAWFTNADGTTDVQAGSHPYEATFVFNVATALNAQDRGYLPGSEIRDFETRVPPGFIGNLNTVPQCSHLQLLHTECPPGSMVGLLKALSPSVGASTKQIFNMVPEAGTPAELGFEYAGIPVYITFSVRSGSDYSIVAHVNDLPQRTTYQAILTLWGVPNEASHDRWRNREGGCSQEEIEKASGVEDVVDYCLEQSAPPIQPFLTLPTSCGEPQSILFRAVSGWQEPAFHSEFGFHTHDASVGFSGCEAIGVQIGFTTAIETSRSDSPTGLTADVKPSLGGLEEPEGLATASIQDATVTLPEGFVVNPGQAAGLLACGPSEDALTTAQEREHGEENDGAPSCPPGSKIGTVTIKSPLIEADVEKQFEGNVYVLQSNPPEIKLLVAASADGVNVKLVGVVHLNEQTGQVETRFEGTPQLPFSDFKLSFEGGVKAALDTPTQCGTFQTAAAFTPWSTPFSASFPTNAAFMLTEGAGGGACPNGPLPFAPSLSAGSAKTEAGAFTSFTMLLTRGDGQQRIDSLSFTSPAGLSAMTSTVPLCGEADANAGTCPAASHIGHAIVASGAGGNPLVLPQPGDPELPIYLTGPYKGAPFGLSIVTPVIAGPFNLGTIVTRARIEVNPVTAQITVTTDPLPQIVKGVPTDIRSIDAVVDRPGFFFNPTNCTPQQFNGTATAVGGATAHLSSSFTVGACQALKFTPHLTASTSSKTSKANGASLNVKITYPAGAQADISRVDLTIPAILPTRLTTIQKACTEAIFNANPASCPAGSVIASALVHTPVLKSPLTGPVYFVSHGNAAFPDVEMVLQGEGVMLVVDGKTQITKGVTFSHFETVPDEPFSSFEFTAPEGPHSIFAANLPENDHGNLCGQKLTIPTVLTAQNGAVIDQSTPITVSGCKPAITVTRHSVSGKTATIAVTVPAAGRLVATAKGLSKGSGKTSKAGTVTVKLTLTKAELARLIKHKGRKLSTKINLQFTPKKGARLTTTTTVAVG
jgi:hypothetical protein